MKQDHLKEYYNNNFLLYTDIPFSNISKQQKKGIRESLGFAQWSIFHHYSEVVVDMANVIKKMNYSLKTAAEAFAILGKTKTK